MSAPIATDHTGPDEFAANARLISAAPDLLAVLKALPFLAPMRIGKKEAMAYVPVGWIDRANAAIAKAEGRQP